MVSSASVIAAAVGYVFNPLIVGRALGPEGIAVLGAFLSLNFALSFAQTPVGFVLTRYAAQYNANQKPGMVATLITRSFKKLSTYALILFIPLAVLSPWLADYLNLKSVTPVLAAVLLAYVGLLLTMVRAPLQGLLRFSRFSLVLLADPISRLLFGASLLWVGRGLSGAMAAYVSGYLAAMALALWVLRDILWHSPKEPVDHLEILASAVPVGMYSLYLAFALSVDGLLVKHYFPDTRAGFYMAASTLSKMVFIVIHPVATVSFSLMCDAVARNEHVLKLFVKNLALTSFICIFFVAASFLFPTLIVNFTYGSEFAQTIPLLPFACLALIPFLFTLNFSNYCLARKTRTFVYGLMVGALLQFLMIVFYHQTLMQVLLAYGVGGIAQCLLSIAFSFSEGIKK